MTWVKQNYDRFLLALVALTLAACAGLLFNNARNFSTVFKSLSDQVPHAKDLPVEVTKSANREAVSKNQEQLAKPALWDARTIDRQTLPGIASTPYIQKDDVLISPYDAKIVIHPPVPNAWLLDHNQNLLDVNVLEQDTDGDGFSTLDEYEAKPQTDPAVKDSHPPYWTKLYLKRFVRIPFVLVFSARNPGGRFQVNTVGDDDAPTQFVKLGDTVTFKTTRFKVAKFEEKSAVRDGIKKDVSELTLQNLENGQTIVLPKGDEVDSPTTYVVFNYLWTGKDFAVLKSGEFTLKPEDNVKYKVEDMSDTEIRVLKLDENKKLVIRARPQSR